VVLVDESEDDGRAASGPSAPAGGGPVTIPDDDDLGLDSAALAALSPVPAFTAAADKPGGDAGVGKKRKRQAASPVPARTRSSGRTGALAVIPTTDPVVATAASVVEVEAEAKAEAEAGGDNRGVAPTALGDERGEDGAHNEEDAAGEEVPWDMDTMGGVWDAVMACAERLALPPPALGVRWRNSAAGGEVAGGGAAGPTPPYDPQYELHGILRHEGRQAFRGHYVSDVRDAVDIRKLAGQHGTSPAASDWFRYDDSAVTKRTWAEVSDAAAQRAAYIAVYTRRQPSAAWR
jgi:hypothetical protein